MIATPLGPAAQKSLDRWLAMVAESDFRDLPLIVAADAVFRSPVGLRPYPGRDLVCLMISTAAGIFEDFEYHRTFVDDDSPVLEFSAHIGGVQLRAIHMIRFDSGGEIIEFEKMVRPLEGAKALGNAMGSKIGPQIKRAREGA